MIIREVTIDDLASLSSLAQKTYAETFGHSFTNEELANILQTTKSEKSFRDFLDNGDNFSIAEIENNVIGYIGLQTPKFEVKGRQPTDKDQALKGIYVSRKFHRQGIGKKLMNAAFDYKRFKQAENVYLCVWEENKPAYNFYLNYSFKKVGTCDVISNGNTIGTDAVMMKTVKN